MGDKQAVPSLIQSLSADQNAQVRTRAAEALKNLQDERAIEPLTRALLADEDDGVKADVAAILADTLGERAVPALSAALRQESSPQLRESITAALRQIGGERALAVIQQTAEPVTDHQEVVGDDEADADAAEPEADDASQTDEEEGQ
jgi:HEAT repeat protein